MARTRPTLIACAAAGLLGAPAVALAAGEPGPEPARTTTTTATPLAPDGPGATTGGETTIPAPPPPRTTPAAPPKRQDGGRRGDGGGKRPGGGRDRRGGDGRPDRSGGGTAPEPSGGAPAPSRDAAAAPATAGDPLGQPAVGLSGLSIARFRIPPFLLPIYQAAGTQYGIRWEVLAAINEIETDYGRNLSVSTAGALGWMQFMPATWRTYGVDGNGDGRRDPYNPVDAIFAAARYLRAAGAAQDLRGAIFAYNHADWYVRDVLERARLVARVPADVIGALTGMTLGQLPVYEPPAASGRRPADGAAKADADGWTGIRGTAGAAAVAVQDGTVTRIGESARLGRFVEIRDAYGNRYSYAGLGRLATQHLVPRRSAGQGERERDSRKPTRSGADEAAADDAATGAATTADAAPTLTAVPPAGVPEDPVPTGPASAGRRPSSARLATTAATEAGGGATGAGDAPRRGPARPRVAGTPGGADGDGGSSGRFARRRSGRIASSIPRPDPAPPVDERRAPTDAAGPPARDPADPPAMVAAPGPTPAAGSAPAPDGAATTAPATLGPPASGLTAELLAPAGSGPLDQPAPAILAPPLTGSPPSPTTGEGDPGAGGRTPDAIAPYLVRAGSVRRSDLRLVPLRRGSKITAGTVLGRLREPSEGRRVSLRFAIRPGGPGAPRIDPRPIVDGWRLLDEASVFGNERRSRLLGDGGPLADVGRLLLMSKEQLQRRVLADRRLSIYPGGRGDIAAGVIDRRVLATLEYLTANGLRLTITSLRTGHGYLSASGNVSEHSSGNAVDIAQVNGITITPATQGPGSITASTIRLLLRLQGTMEPHQIISLMRPSDFGGAANVLALGDHDDHIHVGFRPQAGAGGDAPRLARQVAEVLRPAQWRELADRLAQIDNPRVAAARRR